MRDPEPPGDDHQPVNRRNLAIALGGLAVILLLANIGMPRIGFDGNEDDIDAKTRRLEAAIEKRVGQKLDAAAARIEAKTRAHDEALRAGDEDSDDDAKAPVRSYGVY